MSKVNQPIVMTRSGQVMGKAKDGALLFCGIPYAAPPVADRRFKAAARVDPWDDVLDTTRFSPAAPQIPSGGMTDNTPVRWSEDCLYLNVCTPDVDDRRRPVMVWIHGGAYRTGQGAIPWYNGNSFARQGDIVVVSINYRLGALGFTDLSRFGPDYASSGVNGLLDQITALEWVQDNIENFGGDPDRVTIAGESAGGFSVSSLLGSERAQGLFHRAIPQSGAAHATLTSDEGQIVTNLLLETLKIKSAEELLKLDVTAILEAQPVVDREFSQVLTAVQAFYPVVGNDILPLSPYEAIQSGVGSGVEVLTGSNKDESTLFIMEEVSENRLERQAEGYGNLGLIDQYKSLDPDASATELSIRMSTDFMFKIPAIRLAEARLKQGAVTWLYQFDWESRAGHLKATHALEIPFCFNMLHAPGVNVFIGEGELPQSVADEMHAVWTGFIRGEEPPWPAYNNETRPTWHFDTKSMLLENADDDLIAVWQDLR